VETGQAYQDRLEEEHRARLLELAERRDQWAAVDEFEAKYGPLATSAGTVSGSAVDAFAADEEMKKGIAAFQAAQKPVSRGEERTLAQRGVWLMYGDEEKAAKSGSHAGRRIRVQKWISRMTAASAKHKADGQCYKRKGGGSCVICQKLHVDFGAALRLKKECPIPTGAEREAAMKDEVVRARGEVIKERKTKSASAKKSSESTDWRSTMVKRSDLELLEAPVATSYKVYDEYLAAFRKFLTFRGSLVAELERRENERGVKRGEAKSQKPNTVEATEPTVKSESEVAASAKTKAEQKRAKRARKDAARKSRASVRALEARTLELKLLKTTTALKKEETKVAKLNSKASSSIKDAVPAVKREDEPGVRKESDEKAAKRRLVANQKKRLRKKRSKAAKKVVDEK